MAPLPKQILPSTDPTFLWVPFTFFDLLSALQTKGTYHMPGPVAGTVTK